MIGRRMSTRDALIGSSRRALRRRGATTEARATGASSRAVTFADGTELAVDAVIWATGFGHDHSWIDLPVTTTEGAIRHRRGVTETPGLYFLGLPWQHTRGSALLGWVKDDAEYLAAQISALSAETRTAERTARPQFHHDRSLDMNDMNAPLPSDGPGETEPAADDREPARVERDQAGEWRDAAAAERDTAAGVRDQAGTQRDRAAHERDLVGDQRDAAGEQRDRAAYVRDEAGAQRDLDGDRRDEAAAERDHVAERRDQAEAEGSPAGTTDGLIRSALARRDAASDRRRASADRHAGASGRTEAEHDRDAGASERTEAEHDRDAGASERTESEYDRATANADRGAADGERVAARLDRGATAADRDASSLDELTGAYRPAAGAIEIDREMARSRRMGQPLTLVAVDVADLETVNSSQGRSAGDRMLVDVADTISSIFRPYDVIIRSGADEFVCAISGLGMDDATKRLANVETTLAGLPGHGSVATGFAELQPGDSREDVVARAGLALHPER
jgi:diguanylate cyclase (GGDEF)-like protein